MRKPAERMSPNQSAAAMDRLASFARYHAGEVVYRCNDPAEYWYRIAEGAARKSVLSADGCRHIVDFLLPGDLFGFGEAELHPFCVEALVSGTRIVRYPRGLTERLADTDPQISRHFRQAAFEAIARLQKRMVLLDRTSALQKISAFVLEMADRGRASSDRILWLPMSRYDIADYLAMAVETVSRTLTELRRRGTIDFRGVRAVRICDRQALEQATFRLTAGVGNGRGAVLDLPSPATQAHHDPELSNDPSYAVSSRARWHARMRHRPDTPLCCRHPRPEQRAAF
jgi:CRP/FNR family transcriptional regulator, nitrogen fixation regulation protein